MRGSYRNSSLSEAVRGVNHKGAFTAGYGKDQFRKEPSKICVFRHPRQQWLMPMIEEKLLRSLHASL